ncbi:hypothetical protein HYH02_011592 [Chlamydomonas schloesseri]|uniref:TRP C-terminal domain-containing protein n=1 Tax=Chlamydomonas schloesseri TaxID=2026947 RepID=A0A835T2D3_9CHLO|nr:hypothetical protein HYH02_011592 [Chlamydomonas schloesseri]|eukprot:KAG2436081.1 hypothetical protein HYH02_011592 [Chlamydomonas schloesseri]
MAAAGRPDSLMQKNKYKPDGASEMLPAKKDVRLYRLPECLVLHLKRFTYSATAGGHGGGYSKLHKAVAFGTSLRLDSKAGYLYGYWVANMNQECYTGEHAAFFVPMGIAVIVCCSILPPLFTAISLSRTSLEQRQYDGRTRLMYGFLYKPYKKSLFWYDSMMQLQVFGLVAVSVFGRVMLVEYQALLMLAVLLVFSSINVLARPLTSDSLNNLQFFSSAVLCSTIALSLYFVLGDYLPIAAGGEAAIALIIIVMNVLVVVTFLGLKAREIRQQAADAWAWVAHGGCSACVARYCPKLPCRWWRRGGGGAQKQLPRDAPLEINDPEDGMRIPLDADPLARYQQPPATYRLGSSDSSGGSGGTVLDDRQQAVTPGNNNEATCMSAAWWRGCLQPPADDLPPTATTTAATLRRASTYKQQQAATPAPANTAVAATPIIPMSTAVALITARVPSASDPSSSGSHVTSTRSGAQLDHRDLVMVAGSSVVLGASAGSCGRVLREINSSGAGGIAVAGDSSAAARTQKAAGSPLKITGSGSGAGGDEGLTSGREAEGVRP